MAWSPATLAALQQGSTAPLQENESLLQVRLQEEIQLSLLSRAASEPAISASCPTIRARLYCYHSELSSLSRMAKSALARR